jgi:DNA-binding XRE family transcriptional regulator
LKPQTLGGHIRKRRLDLGLLQIEVVAMIGVSENTVWNWEHGTEKELKHIPTIIAFLGHVLRKCPGDTLGRLAHFKKIKGLSFKRFGPLMGRDPKQLPDRLSGRKAPIEKDCQKLQAFLDVTTKREQKNGRADGLLLTDWRLVVS